MPLCKIPTISLADDVAFTKRVIAAQGGPVVLVGHSYGGAVITEAGNDPNVASLVYIAAFALDEGESVSTLIKDPVKDTYTSGPTCEKIAQLIANAPARPVQECGANFGNVNTTSTQNGSGLPYTISPSITPPNAEQEEEERSRERTRAFNEQNKLQQQQCKGCAPPAETLPKKKPN